MQVYNLAMIGVWRVVCGVWWCHNNGYDLDCFIKPFLLYPLLSQRRYQLLLLIENFYYSHNF